MTDSDIKFLETLEKLHDMKHFEVSGDDETRNALDNLVKLQQSISSFDDKMERICMADNSDNNAI